MTPAGRRPLHRPTRGQQKGRPSPPPLRTPPRSGFGQRTPNRFGDGIQRSHSDHSAEGLPRARRAPSPLNTSPTSANATPRPQDGQRSTSSYQNEADAPTGLQTGLLQQGLTRSDASVQGTSPGGGPQSHGRRQGIGVSRGSSPGPAPQGGSARRVPGLPLREPVSHSHPPPEPAPRRQEEELHGNYINWLQEELSRHYREATTCRMKAEEALRIIQSTVRECKRNLRHLLGRDCRGLVRVMMRGRPGGSSSGPPTTQEDAGSPQASRHSPQVPLDMGHTPNEETISELPFIYNPDDLPYMDDGSQWPEHMNHPPPKAGRLAPTGRPRLTRLSRHRTHTRGPPSQPRPRQPPTTQYEGWAPSAPLCTPAAQQRSPSPPHSIRRGGTHTIPPATASQALQTPRPTGRQGPSTGKHLLQHQPGSGGG